MFFVKETFFSYLSTQITCLHLRIIAAHILQKNLADFSLLINLLNVLMFFVCFFSLFFFGVCYNITKDLSNTCCNNDSR